MEWATFFMWLSYGILVVVALVFALCMAVLGWGRWIERSINRNIHDYKDRRK